MKVICAQCREEMGERHPHLTGQIFDLCGDCAKTPLKLTKPKQAKEKNDGNKK
jgi:hypothetical protein